MRKYFLALVVCFFLGGCASLTPQAIRTSDVTVHLHTSYKTLQEAYKGYVGKDGDNIRGFYVRKNNEIHCIKWDFYACGHELHHALQQGTPKLNADGDKHFK